MTGRLPALARRPLTGVVTFMVVTTVAATAVGFWLSYAGLHVFALRAGLRGAEAWAWPASVDLFILTGELGITVSAIRRQPDWLAWVYLVAGFGPSVVFNILHVTAITPWWSRYAVAAVPPIAAMLALAALMRQVFRLAVESVPETVPDVPETGNGAPAHLIEAQRRFAAEIAAGDVPTIREIRAGLAVGAARATEVQRHLSVLTRT